MYRYLQLLEGSKKYRACISKGYGVLSEQRLTASDTIIIALVCDPTRAIQIMRESGNIAPDKTIKSMGEINFEAGRISPFVVR